MLKRLFGTSKQDKQPAEEIFDATQVQSERESQIENLKKDLERKDLEERESKIQLERESQIKNLKEKFSGKQAAETSGPSGGGEDDFETQKAIIMSRHYSAHAAIDQEILDRELALKLQEEEEWRGQLRDEQLDKDKEMALSILKLEGIELPSQEPKGVTTSQKGVPAQEKQNNKSK